VTSVEKIMRRYAIGLVPLLSSLTVFDERTWRFTLRAGSPASAVVENVEATVASVGMLALAGIAAFAEAPPASDESGTGTLTAPGAALGMATASLDEKLEPEGTGVLVAGGPGGTGGAPDDDPPPPHAARMARPSTAPPKAEIRFMPRLSDEIVTARTCASSRRYRDRDAAFRARP
jgi:hypothetical protein